MTPEIRDRPQRLTAMRRQVIHPHDIGMTIGKGIPELGAALVHGGAEVLSAPYARYHTFSEDEADVEIGFEVAAPVEIEGVSMGSLGAGREAVATHHGAYKDIPDVFADLEAWVKEHAQIRDAPREVYLSDPATVPMDERVTEVIFPIV